MAKGITIFGTLNGTLGETVYYRSGGEQKQRIRIRKPKNPQSNKQLFQRARFAAAGMFYTHGRQSFFPYAFEDKRPNESNFNAFMRNNIALAYPVSKSVVDNVAYPIINEWIVTKGSLPKLQVERYSWDNGQTDGVTFTFPNYSSLSAITTMADLSRALIATGDYENGDIITFLTILTDVRLSSTGYGIYPEIAPTMSEAAHWFIKQFNVNMADTTLLSSYGITASIENNNTVRLGIFGPNSSWWANQLACGTVIHSRVRGSRTQVSTQQLVLSQTAQTQLNTYLAGNYQQYIEEVIANWRTGDITVQLRPEETLQGANSINLDFTPEPTVNPLLTISKGDLTDGWIRPPRNLIGTLPQASKEYCLTNITLNGESIEPSAVYFEAEDGSETIIQPASGPKLIKIADCQQGGEVFARLTGSGSLYSVITDSDVPSTTITAIKGFKVTRIDYQDTTYTNFNYEVIPGE